jgi:hypothetical protein
MIWRALARLCQPFLQTVFLADELALTWIFSPPYPPPLFSSWGPFNLHWRAEVVGNLIDELLAGRKSIRIEDPHSEHPLEFEALE